MPGSEGIRFCVEYVAIVWAMWYPYSVLILFGERGYKTMNKMYQWILSFLLVLPLMLVTAWAAESGTCGGNVTWTLGDSGDLVISGTGYISDYEEGTPPWRDKNILPNPPQC